MKVSAKFKPNDLWVGAYWERTVLEYAATPHVDSVTVLDVWVCIIPMLPIKFHFGLEDGRAR